jgi:hypothetical protein
VKIAASWYDVVVVGSKKLLETLLVTSRIVTTVNTMSTKQDSSCVSNDAGCESVDDNPSRHGVILCSSTVAEPLSNTNGGNQLPSPMNATMQKRSRPPIAFDETATKKNRADSLTSAPKEEFQSHANVDAYHGEFDLCTPEGQIAASKAENPEKKTQMTWEQAKHAARREYNRVNAARARQRHKEEAETRDQQIAELKSQVEQLTRLNEVLMNYICELQASSNTQSVAHMDTTFETKKSAANGMQPNSNSAMIAATNFALMSLLKEKQMAEDAQVQQNHQTYINSNAATLQSGKSYMINDRCPNLAGGPIVRGLQLQQLLAETAKNNNASYPWNAVPGMPPSQATTNSLWDVLLSIQQLNNMLPSSGAPK